MVYLHPYRYTRNFLAWGRGHIPWLINEINYKMQLVGNSITTDWNYVMAAHLWRGPLNLMEQHQSKKGSSCNPTTQQWSTIQQNFCWRGCYTACHSARSRRLHTNLLMTLGKHQDLNQTEDSQANTAHNLLVISRLGRRHMYICYIISVWVEYLCYYTSLRQSWGRVLITKIF